MPSIRVREARKQMTAKKMGRPTTYNAKLAAEICGRMAAGESVRKICRDPEMPDFKTVMRWAHDPNHPSFKEGFPDQ